MDLTLLATLKDKLIHAKEFSDVMNYFFDHFGEDPDFIALGERTESPFLVAVLEQVGEQMFGRSVQLTNLLMTRLPEHQFIHGGFIINGRLANLIYFEDIHKGLMAVVASVSPGETKFVRFTGRPMPPNWSPSRN
jgi:hypothetical protein